MQCDEVQKICSAATHSVDSVVKAHLDRCEVCKAFADDMVLLDRELLRALELTPRDGLKDDLLKIPGESKKGIIGKWVSTLAIAASIFLAVGIFSWVFLNRVQETERLPQIVYQHVINEPYAFASKNVLEDTLVSDLMKKFGISLTHSIGPVTYISQCPIRNTQLLHMVVYDNETPITFLYMPTISINQKITIREKDLMGRIIPVRIGSLAIIGAESDATERMAAKIPAAIEWL